ncbi:alpha/beta fold hydrolase [Planktotalea sp.]|uniref:alpha/beta fold hydrolase n=1 Tax=Planktotalea sp. TaxID=2029877 RepID=UPI0025DB1D1D|nr:alpha/beta fold hydrolase [Planktotalea sp.]
MSARTEIMRGDVTLSAHSTGRKDGPTILLSNSLGAGLNMWAPQRAALEAHYNVIGYDTRGHGQSSTPDGDYTFDDLSADAVAVLDHFNVAKADYIGLSLGGMTGLGLGLDHAERFNKIVCASARADNPAPFVSSWDDRIAAIAKGGMSAIWNGTVERWLTPEFFAANPELVEKLESDFKQTTVTGYTGCARALQTLDYKRRLGDMTVPTLFISGADDFGAPSAEMKDLSAKTPNAHYIDIPDCAHIANLNQTDAFNTAVQNFLEF